MTLRAVDALVPGLRGNCVDANVLTQPAGTAAWRAKFEAVHPAVSLLVTVTL